MKSICFLFLLIPAFAFAASQKYLANVEKRLDLLFSTEVPDTAVLKAVRIVTEDDSLSPKETEGLYAKKILPFIKKKKANVSHLMLAVAYRSCALTVSKMGLMEEYRKYMERAYNHILQVGDTGYQELRQKGAVCYSYASMQLFFGDIAKAHEVFYQAIRAAEKIKDYNKVMESFYALAIYYTQTKDTKRLDNILADIREVFRKAEGDVPPRAYYSWYSVATARYALDTDRPEMRDSALLYSRKSLDIVEKYGPELERGTANFAWNYYNHALFFIEKPYVNEDSASYYLEKARQVPQRLPMHAREVELNVQCAYATLYKSQGQYPKAIKVFKEALRMMDADTINNGIRQERLDAYENIVSMDSALGNYKEAMAFQQKIIDYHQQVYDGELARQLDEISTKFGVEKKNLELQNLKEREEQRTVILRLLIGSLVAAVVIIVFVVWIYILRRRRLQDRLYQAALESEMNLQELETVKSQYSDLKDSLESRQVLRNFEVAVEKMKAVVASARLDPSVRDEYVKRLSGLDLGGFEHQFATSISQMTQMDIKYILCFYLEFEARDIATIFHVEPASVYTVRYRLRKKFRDNPSFQFLMR